MECPRKLKKGVQEHLFGNKVIYEGVIIDTNNLIKHDQTNKRVV